MRIKRSMENGVAILALTGNISGGGDYNTMRSEIKCLLYEDRRDVLLDFSGVAWISSTGVGLILTAFHLLRDNGGRLKICCLQRRVLSILYVTRLHIVCEVHTTRRKALAAFATDRSQAVSTGS